jgi:hypothetical protein
VAGCGATDRDWWAGPGPPERRVRPNSKARLARRAREARRDLQDRGPSQASAARLGTASAAPSALAAFREGFDRTVGTERGK